MLCVNRTSEFKKLIQHIQQHDSEADIFLESKVKPSVLRIIRNHRLTYQEEDLWQEIRTQVWKKIDTCLAESEECLKSWVRSITYHHCRNVVRSEKRTPILLQYCAETEEQTQARAAEPDLADQELKRTLDRALKNQFERMVIELRYVYDYTPTEIAAKLQKSINTVNTSLLRAKKHLRSYLLDTRHERQQILLHKERQRV
jgi:RNA polymerase sigma factor (sigma-70 family)